MIKPSELKNKLADKRVEEMHRITDIIDDKLLDDYYSKGYTDKDLGYITLSIDVGSDTVDNSMAKNIAIMYKLHGWDFIYYEVNKKEESDYKHNLHLVISQTQLNNDKGCYGIELKDTRL